MKVIFLARKRPLAVIISLVLFAQSTYAAVTEFNTDVLDLNERDNVDLSRFSDSDYVLPGDYLLEVKINQKTLPLRKISFIALPEDPKKIMACLPADMINSLTLKSNAVDKIRLWNNGECADITAIDGTKISNRIGSGVLLISIPQAYMKYSDPNWTPPEQWDDGVPGLLLDYNFNWQSSKTKSNSEVRNISTYGTVGANAGAWRLRADYQYNASKQGNTQSSDFTWSQLYAYRALPMHAAKLMMGEAYLNSQVFDGFRYTGINLASDERMLPPSLQGYAPEIRGIANSNAKVTVSQDGRLIYETTVPAGPFVIDSLNSAVRGRLDVKIEEEDGSISTFSSETANLPYLTRPGQVRYNTTIGRPSNWNHNIEGSLFSTSDFSWGVSNAWSLYGGAMLAGNYNAWSLGIGRDLSLFGAASVDVTQSVAKLPQQPTDTGLSFKFSWAKRFDEIDGQITFAGYRFSQRKFMNMGQYLQAKNQDYDDYLQREKEMYTITASKTFMANKPEEAITAYVTYTHQTYWDARQQSSYGVSASKTFDIGRIQNVSATLSLNRSEYNGQQDDSMMFSLSVPIGDRRRVSYNLQSYRSNVTQTASYSDSVDTNNTWQISSGIDQDNKTLARGYYTRNMSAGTANVSAAWQQDGYSSFGGSFRGGITATRYGAALHRNSGSGSTRMMVDTDGVSGVPIDGGSTFSNYFGTAVVSDVASYYETNTKIDVNELADDVEATKSVIQGTLTEGAIGYRRFDVVKGSKMLAIIKLADGSVPPFGSEVINAKGRSVAVVNDGGQIYLTGVSPEEILDIAWDGKKQCQLAIPKTFVPLNQILLPCEQH